VPVSPGAPIGVPAAAQTVMFLTQSYTAKQREETNIHYIIRQAGDAEDGIDFCRKVALSVKRTCLSAGQPQGSAKVLKVRRPEAGISFVPCSARRAFFASGKLSIRKEFGFREKGFEPSTFGYEF